MRYLTLNNGIKMPILGFGTYSVHSKDVLLQALDSGYRLFDTAQMYHNEKELGLAINEAMQTRGIKRQDFFITTKLSSNMSFDEAQKSIDLSLRALNLDYVDLLLIHEPYPQAKQMYEAMQIAYKEGKVRALGLSSFRPKPYLDFVKGCEILPTINQCETHIYYQQKALKEAMKAYGTVLQSWSPFIAGKNGFFESSSLKQIARKHKKSVAQIALRFLIEQDIVAIPKASKLTHMQDNINIFDFALDEEDMQNISKLDKNQTQFSWGY